MFLVHLFTKTIVSIYLFPCEILTVPGVYLMEAAFDGSVNVELHKFSADSVTQYLLNDTPAHFDVLSGCLLKSPPEPRSESIVAAVTSGVAVFSVPECVVGVPLPVEFWRWVQRGRFTVKILANKWRRTSSWKTRTRTVTEMEKPLLEPSCISPNVFATILRPVCD